MFLPDLFHGNSLLGDVPESLALLLSGVCLIGATFGLRRLLKRYEEKTEKEVRQK